jgi:hypothetical protein
MFAFLGTSVPVDHSTSESLLHEPWQVLLSQFLTLALVVATTIIAARNSRKVKDVGSQITTSVGVANGHGSLMDQATVHGKQIGDLQNHVFEIKDDLGAHTEKADGRFAAIEHQLSMAAKKDHVDVIAAHLERTASKDQVSQVQSALDGHIAESSVYRAGVEEKLSTLASTTEATQAALAEHTEWEMTQKYVPQSTVERRAPGSPPRTKNERRKNPYPPKEGPK